MSGIYTDKRALDISFTESEQSVRYHLYSWPAGYEVTIGTQGSPVYSDQTTTSYRTGRGGQNRASMTNAEIFANAKEDARRQTEPYDTGHEFDSVKHTVHHFRRKPFEAKSPSGKTYVTGPLVPYRIDGGEDFFMKVPNADLSFGTRAIQGTIPTRPQANVAQFVGELRNLPSLPFVKDILKVCQSISVVNSTIAQYVSDSGPEKQVRRSVSFPVIKSTQTVYDKTIDRSNIPFKGWTNINMSSEMGSILNPVGDPIQVNCIEQKSDRYWFSGAYSYVVPAGDSIHEKLVMYEGLVNKVLGSRLTPAVLWELAPWSWLADWWGDIGSILSNASALSQDGLVLRYGYLMCESTYDRTILTGDPGFYSGKIGTSMIKYRTVRKQRVRATPYGFGLDLSTLSGQQWSILASLGLTKGNSKHLRD